MSRDFTIMVSDTDEKTIFITSWYSSDDAAGYLEPVNEAYNDAVSYFKQHLTQDECKRIWVDGKTTIEHVHQAVLAAKQSYESSKKSKARVWLSRLCSRMMYYGAIMDTLSQHHPEYVSLVWGAMKFLFIGVLNQEELVYQLSKALAAIADALPRVKLHTILYPSKIMKHSVAMLHARIIKFFHRAMMWYKEGKLKHLYTSFARPASLRFKDLVDEIAEYSNRVDQVAAASAHAEQRDMHRTQLATQTTVNELDRTIRSWITQNRVSDRFDEILKQQQITQTNIAQMEQRFLCRLEECHSLYMSQFLNTNRRLYDIQYSQILSFTAATSLMSPDLSLQYCQSMTRFRSSNGAYESDLIKATAQLQAWASSGSSSLILIKGSIAAKNTTKNLATDIVSLVKDTKVPVIWALNARREAAPNNPGPVEVLKQLVLQSLQLNTTLMDEYTVSTNVSRFRSARSEKEWFDLLGSVLEGLPNLFIIVDIETLGSRSGELLNWPAAFMFLFQELTARNVGTILKVALVSYHKSLHVPSAVKQMNRLSVVCIGKRGKDNTASYLARKKALVGRSVRASANGGGLSLIRRNLFAFKEPGIPKRTI